VQVTNDEEVTELKTAVAGCFANPLGADLATVPFPGIQPTQFYRKNLSTIQGQVIRMFEFSM
jgi:hypothetical protein